MLIFSCWAEVVHNSCKTLLICRFEAVVREVLLGTRFPGNFFGHSVMRFIDHQFLTHDFTTAVLRKGLQVCTLISIGHQSRVLMLQVITVQAPEIVNMGRVVNCA